MRGFLMTRKIKFSIEKNLSTAIAETLAAGSALVGQLKIEAIPLNKVELDPENPRDLAITLADIRNDLNQADVDYERKQQEYNNLRSFSEEIKEDGLINPITVYQRDDGYRLIAGERRTLACTIAGLTHVPARILAQPPTEYKLSRLQWHENQNRLNLTLWENLQGLNRLLKTYITNVEPDAEVTPTLIAKIASCSVPHASNFAALLAEPTNSQLLETVRSNAIKNLEKAALIAKTERDDVRDQLLKECVDGATLDTMKKLAKSSVNAEKKSTSTPATVNKKPGRAAAQVNLGKTKSINAARIIFESVTERPEFEDLKKRCGNINWEDYGSVSSALHQLLQLLEKAK